MNSGLAEDLTGLLGSRAIVYFNRRFYSPVYGHQEWHSEHVIENASCAIGCAIVPSDRHQGCGFHAHWQINETKSFVEQIRGTADCLVLVECFGRVAVHEKGFRAERARIIAVLDWDPRSSFFAYPVRQQSADPSVPRIAVSYFGVPSIGQADAQALIDLQRRVLGQ